MSTILDTGASRGIQAVLPGMRARRSGCIANVTSISGKLALSPFGAYSASKFALEAVSECLAQEVKPFGIRVCVVEPGIIDTDMARDISGAVNVAFSLSAYPNKRRMAGFFAAALKQPTPPGAVADKLVESPVAAAGSSGTRWDPAPRPSCSGARRSATRPGSSGALSTTTPGTRGFWPTSASMREPRPADRPGVQPHRTLR